MPGSEKKELEAHTNVWVEDLLDHQLEELFGHTTLVNALLPFKLYVQLFLQVGRILHGDHLKLWRRRRTKRWHYC